MRNQKHHVGLPRLRMTYYVSSGTLNPTHSLTNIQKLKYPKIEKCTVYCIKT